MIYNYSILGEHNEDDHERVKDAILAVDGVDDAKVDQGSGNVTVNGMIDRDVAIIAAIHATGFLLRPH